MVRIERFDPHAATPDAWAAYHAFRHIRAIEDDPSDPILSDAETEHSLREHMPLWRNEHHFALEGTAILGVAGIGLRREGTPDFADFAPYMAFWGGVLQDRRRAGIASALLRPVLAFMRQHAKTTASIGTHLPEGHAFLQAIGAVQKQRQVENHLHLAGLDWTELARWEAAAPPGLRWDLHAGRVPLDRLARLVPDFTVLIQDEPRGEMDGPANRFTVDGYANWYKDADRYGGEHLLVLLLDSDAVTGMCECSWDPRFPSRIYQRFTAVARSWRGRGVAKAVKARMLRLVRDQQPGVTLMTTNNATSNAPMLSINTRLGFARHQESGTYQVGPDALDAFLLTRTPQPGA